MLGISVFATFVATLGLSNMYGEAEDHPRLVNYKKTILTSN